MNSVGFTLIKRAYTVYREAGFVEFLRVTFLYLMNLFALPFYKDGDVLFISGCAGGSMKFRCNNVAEELAYHGIRTKVVFASQPFLEYLTKRFEIFIFHRVIHNNKIKAAIDSIKSQGKELIFETDDLVYDRKYIRYLDLYRHMGKLERSWYDNGIGREIIGDPYVKNCTVTTHFLAGAIKQDYPEKKVYILRNKLASDQVRHAQKAFAMRERLKPKDGMTRIAYISGSKSHDKDFATISEVVLKIVKEHRNVVLMIVGPLNLEKKFDVVRGQVECYPMVSMKKVYPLIARSDINIAPLEIDNPFCNAKSELKYFEAALLEVPIIATPTDAFQYAIKNGVNGLLAATSQEWNDTIEKLIEDSRFREEIGKRARIDALEKYTTLNRHQDAVEFIDFIRNRYE